VHFETKTVEGEIDFYDDLFAVASPSQTVALAVGNRGAIYRSGDSGGTWSVQRVQWAETRTRAVPLLYGVSMGNEQHGWVVGQLGTILRSDDGGTTWKPQVNPKAQEGYHLFRVHALDANTAVAVGEWGGILYTEDGGTSWQDRSLTITIDHPQYVWLTPTEQERVRSGEKVFEDVSLNDVHCRPLPSTRCWIVGEFGYIFWSDDGGHHWTPAEIVGGASFDPIYFEFDKSDISDADAARLKTFVESILEQSHLNVLIEAFANEKEMKQYASGDDPTTLFDILEARTSSVRAVIEETGILSDRLRLRGTPPWDYEDFLADDPDFLKRYIEGRRADQPRVNVEIAQNPYLFSVRFTSDDHGIITGLGGVVLTSDDGGRTWRYGQTGTRQALFALASQNGRAVAVGEKGLVRVTSDGGRTWGPPADGSFPEIFTFMRDVAFEPSGRQGFAVGQRGLVLRTRDQGATWEQVLPSKALEKTAAGA
jgi:photosystem II stability/assembly factor-like uncharacterized protein